MTTQLPALTPDQFAPFAKRLYDYAPFRWQSRLAEQACGGDWPQFIKLPTSSGKTTCIDIAVFALAYQASRRAKEDIAITAARRLFFVVDRRIIVNEAYLRASNLCDVLEKALTNGDSSDPVYLVAAWLRTLAANDHARPLDCVELRGGIYRDDAWVRSMLQPTIITSTVDQIGSRLLFRGYGVSDRNLPIHAALTANDSMVLLDEAHCSKPFSQTMTAISQFRDGSVGEGESALWAERSLRTPFGFTQMTATPDDSADDGSIFELKPEDYDADEPLEKRHGCSKPVHLVECNAKGAQQYEKLAKQLVTEAKRLSNPPVSNDTPCHRIAIVVNRVTTAQAAWKLLKKEFPDTSHLMIGRMRPIDRDDLTTTLQGLFQSNPNPETLNEPHFVVTTQCLEVGADFDFDGMVTQCASIDALRQRFGRLNRLGVADHSRGVIVMPSGDLKPKKADPIYRTALPATWEWLQANATHLDEWLEADFGIRAMDALLGDEKSESPQRFASLTTESENAPVLMPAHLDILCQTAPRPTIEPDIATFLHGPGSGVPEVRICWRADLPYQHGGQHEFDDDLNKDADWANAAREVVAICPPSAAEMLSVSLHRFRDWINGVDVVDETGDVEGELKRDDGDPPKPSDTVPANRRGIVWTGQQDRDAFVSARTARTIRPNDTIVLPVTAGGWDHFGHIPDKPAEPPVHTHGNSQDTDESQLRVLARIDVADRAFAQSRNRIVIRLHRHFINTAADGHVWEKLKAYANAEGPAYASTADLEAASEDADATPEHSLSQRCKKLAKQKGVRLVRCEHTAALIGCREERAALPRASFDDNYDEHNVTADERQELLEHLADVTQETQRLVGATQLEQDLADAIICAAERHDLGKADSRFQAMLLNSSPDLAHMQPKLWAKSARGTSRKQAAGQNESSNELPTGFRHEMLSIEFAERLECDLDENQKELMLHAIASHHGHARPFAPVAIDHAPPPASLNKLRQSDLSLTLTRDDRGANLAAHQLASGIAERFWTMNRRFGWWGLAWLESSLRLADWVASAAPETSATNISFHASDSPQQVQKTYQIDCRGLNATNPLAYLAALGLARTLSIALPTQCVRMSWQQSGYWHPRIELQEDLSAVDLVGILHASLAEREADSHFTSLGKNTTVPRSEFREALLVAMNSASNTNRTTSDFLAAFGSDALISPNDEITIQDTALRTMAGAGHQHFLETMQNVIKSCEIEHLQKAVFEAWRYDDPTQTLSLRFDPLDDNRHALRWRNPSGDPGRKKSGSMLGANRLAIEAIPLLTTVPGSKYLSTTGFTGHRSSDTFFKWPVWTQPIPVDVIRSVLTLDQSDSCADRGIPIWFKSQRITVGKVRNFTPGIRDENPVVATR